MLKGFDVIGSETHGMSQRGGSVISHLKIGGYKSPLIRAGDADILFIFEKGELIRNLPFLTTGGKILLNAGGDFELPENIENVLALLSITTYRMDANQIALKLKSPLVANIILLGFCSSKDILPITKEEFIDAIRFVSPEKFLDLNIQAFEAGFNYNSK